MNADDVIKAVRDLPSLPAVVVELLSTMQRDDIDTHALGAKIALDQALTAKTLRLANSSFYGMSTRIPTIQQAISVLGFHNIRTLVTACSVTASFAPVSGSDFDFSGFWRHAIATAVCARVLAPRYRLNPDTAFTAGLLHDLGTLVLATRFSDEYRSVGAYRSRHDCTSTPAQVAVFGMDHAAVGAALAEHWKFPAAIQAAVAEHHSAEEHGPGQTPVTLSTIVYLANVLAHALDLAGQDHDQAPLLPLSAWQTLAPTLEADDAVFIEIERLFLEMCQMLTP